MANISHNLFIKYGLRNTPTEDQIRLWISITETLISSGHDPEIAGNAAAKQVFPDYNSCVYCSQADTIAALLAGAKQKTGSSGGSNASSS